MINFIANILFGVLTIAGLQSGVWYGIAGSVILIAVFVHTQHQHHMERQAYLNRVIADEFEKKRARSTMWL